MWRLYGPLASRCAWFGRAASSRMSSRMQTLPIVKQTALLSEVATFLMSQEQRPAALLDPKARFAAVNGAFERLVGHTSSKLVGKQWASVLAQPADAKNVRSCLRDA